MAKGRSGQRIGAPPSNFSLYSLVDTEDTGIISTQRSGLLAAWCLRIQESVISRQLNPIVYARLHPSPHLPPLRLLYRVWGVVAEHLWVFDDPGCYHPSIEGLEYIDIEEEGLAGEQFLVVSHDAYACAVVAQQTWSLTSPDDEPGVQGMFIGNPAQVARLAEALERRIGQRRVLSAQAHPLFHSYSLMATAPYP
jgi:hypothetical protein